MTEYKTLQPTIEDDAAIVMLNPPDRLNSFTKKRIRESASNTLSEELDLERDGDLK